MKSFFRVLKLSFLLIGGVVGAGFLSGREILSFFGKGNFFFNAFLSFGVLCFLFLSAFFLYKKVGDKGVNNALFGKSKINEYFSFLALTICLICMLSALNALIKTFFGVDSCLFSLVTLLLCFFISKGNIKWIEIVNFILTFLTIILLCVCLFEKGNFNFESERKIKVINPVIFSFINFYLCLPIFFKGIKGKNNIEIVISIVVASIVLVFMAFLIYGAINEEKLNLNHLELPIFAVTKGVFLTLMALSLLTGILSSTLITYYSVVKNFSKEHFNIKKIVFSALLVVLSKISLTSVVNYLYPIIAGFGVLFLIKTAVFFIKGIKEKRKTNNNIKR